MEVEILKEAPLTLHGKNRRCCRDRRHRKIPREADRTLGVAHSNLIERAASKRPKRGSQTCRRCGAHLRYPAPGGRPAELYPADRRALKRERRAAGLYPVNAKRVYRLMKKNGLLLARHIGRRIPRVHDGTIMTSRSNERWCSDALEFTSWIDEIVLSFPGQP